MVKAIRDVENARGGGMKKPTQEEEESKKVARRTLVAKVDIPKGAIVIEEMLVGKKQGNEICPQIRNAICRARAVVDIPADTSVTWEVLL